MKNALVELEKILENMGIQNGDILYIASDITLLLYTVQREYGIDKAETFLNECINIFEDLVTESGTLLFPMFTWAPCRGETFDIRHSKSEVGALNNWVLQHRPEFVRTAHPIYSFLVWGKDAEDLASFRNESAWGEDSPFGYFHRNHAKMLLIDVHLKQCYTFMHYVEEQLRVPYRYMKNFRINYIDQNGKESERSYTMFVRDLAIKSALYTPDEKLLANGIMVEKRWRDIPLRIVDMARSYPIYENDLRYDGGKWSYNFSGYELEWEKGQTHPDDLHN